MKRFWPFLAIATITCALILPQGSIAAQNEEATPTQSATWGSIKAMYRSDGTATILSESPLTLIQNQLKSAATDEEVQQILDRAPAGVRDQLMQQSEGLSSFPSEPAWSNPVAQEAISKYSLNTTDVLAVQRVVMLSNGVPIDSAEVVVTEKQWYYKSLVDQSFSQSPPSLPLTTEMDIYGSEVVRLTWHQDCWSDQMHWGVAFYLPVCFYELWPGRFDGIIDAWAPRPNCSPWCNGGYCALWMCGDAWDGAGYLEWWNYHQSCSDPRASKRVAKIVQKRWLHTWQLCYGYADRYIASLVRVRIRF